MKTKPCVCFHRDGNVTLHVTACEAEALTAILGRLTCDSQLFDNVHTALWKHYGITRYDFVAGLCDGQEVCHLRLRLIKGRASGKVSRKTKGAT